jgi:hypothetical protein
MFVEQSKRSGLLYLCTCVLVTGVWLTVLFAGGAMTALAGAEGFGLVPGSGGVSVTASNADGSPDFLAGSHPYQGNLTVALKTTKNAQGKTEVLGGLKDVHLEVPPGLIGDPLAVPACSFSEFTTPGPPNEANGQALLGDFEYDSCPTDTQIGVATIDFIEHGGSIAFSAGVYNLAPPPGVPAEFGFDINGSPVTFKPSVRTGGTVARDGDYGLSLDARDLAQALTITGFSVTLWGVPASSSHDHERQPCLTVSVADGAPGACPVTTPPVAFLRAPTSCVGPLESRLAVDDWEEPGSFTADPGSINEEGLPDFADQRWQPASILTEDGSGDPAGFVGCESLPFEPSISIAPDTREADTPAGLTATVAAPQRGLLEPEGRAEADLKNTTVTLPPGFAINPGQANGLVACQQGETGLGTEGPPSCPAASQVGTTEAETPLLHHKFKGDVYVLQSNPPNIKLLVALSDPPDGVFVKLVGDVHLDQATGQISTTFSETPQLPISNFTLSFSGGAQAALVTPSTCGTYTTNTDFTPWSTPAGADVLRSSAFNIEQGPGGGACPLTPLPFEPAMIAGASTDQAGGYTDFSLLLQRADGQQKISSLQFKTPEGLLGMIAKVPLCQEPQAAQGTCSSASQIGHTVVEAGPGPDPLVVPGPGQAPAPIYLTGGYKGAPYGLSIAVPVIAGPFNLGTVVVRSKIDVDPHTAQLTITTDPLPSILDGVPTDLRTINAVIDRPGFMFNPTNCSPQSFSGTAFSTEGATASISSPFQVGSCRSLTFKPNFKVSTSGKTSRKNGASLDAKILYPTGAPGANQASSQANVASVKVDLPKQLPSRLTTLQKACTAAQFDANPAGCPAASVVGHASAVTPVLPVELSGPAYFVSHGGEAFPQLIVVLQGYGVTVDLIGDTFISRKGITSSTFKQVPDVPITSFDLTLPEGKYSALAANGDLCKSKLAMPTLFVAQNGATIKQSTKIDVAGCAKKNAKQAKKQKQAKKKSTNGKGSK